MMTQDQASESAVGNGEPMFPTALRGYDKQAVDVFIHEQRSRLAAERERADQAERESEEMKRTQAPATFEHLGVQAAKVLEQAGNSATVLIEEARASGEKVIEEARAKAGELLQAAQQQQAQMEEAGKQALADAASQGEQIVAKAREDADQLRRHAEDDAKTRLADVEESIRRAHDQGQAEQQSMASEIERLTTHRNRLREELTRAYHDLGRVLTRAADNDAQAVGPVHAQEEEPSLVAGRPETEHIHQQPEPSPAEQH
jgi:peptidoglycan DL-endopeptidase RipA